MARYTTHVARVATGTSLKTVLQLTAAAQRLGLYGVAVTFGGTSSVAPAVLVRIARTTSTGTSTGTPTVVSVDNSFVASTVTAQSDFSAEPDIGDVLWVRDIHPQTGLAEWIPLGDEFNIVAFGRVAFSVLSATNAPVTLQPYWREGQ
jgi:hypothetical protein